MKLSWKDNDTGNTKGKQGNVEDICMPRRSDKEEGGGGGVTWETESRENEWGENHQWNNARK